MIGVFATSQGVSQADAGHQEGGSQGHLPVALPAWMLESERTASARFEQVSNIAAPAGCQLVDLKSMRGMFDLRPEFEDT